MLEFYCPVCMDTLCVLNSDSVNYVCPSCDRGYKPYNSCTIYSSEEETLKLHDDHYRNKVIEPIKVQEQVMLDLTSVPADRRHFLAQAIRYIMRAGTKDDNPWEKDIEKALNYLNRALTGKWRDE